VSVLPSQAVTALAAFAKDNQETQGKFTIGDEKKHNVFMRPEVGTQQMPCFVHQLTRVIGPRDPKGHWRDRPRRHHDQAARDEEQLQVSRLSWTSSGSPERRGMMLIQGGVAREVVVEKASL
jgi:hypothetical protein